MSAMDKLADNLTLLIAMLGKVVAATHPVKLFLGLLTGVVLSNVSPFVAVIYPEFMVARALGAVDYAGHLAIGIILWIAPTVIRKTSVSEDNKAYIDLIETVVKNGDFSATEKRQFYRMLTQKALEGFTPKEGASVDTRKAINTLQQASKLRDDSVE